MAAPSDPKATLQRYLEREREALVWKLDGLGEREARLPRTSSGNSLLGLLKHCLHVEAGYFGTTFGRVFPQSSELVGEEEYDADPQADWYAREDETLEGLLDLARRVWAFADGTIEELPLEALGRVPWWPPERAEVTLGRVMVHVLAEVARHAGQADILREGHDAAIGLRPGATNIAEGYDWAGYVRKLTALAERDS